MKGLKEKTIKTIVIVGLVVVFIIGTIIAGIVMFIKRDDIRGGFGYKLSARPINIGVKSNTNTFKTDDVDIQLYYSFYKSDKKNEARKYPYQRETTDKIMFCMYICDEGETLAILNDQEYIDYKNIANHTFIKELSEEEVFSEENKYACSIKYLTGTTYNYHETIDIPKEVFREKSGEFVIKLVSFILPTEERNTYYSKEVGYISLKYSVLDKNIVKIEYVNSSN